MKIGDIIQLKRWKEPGANPAYHREVWRVTGFDGDYVLIEVTDKITGGSYPLRRHKDSFPKE